jgi:hypothetical protein
MFSDEELRHIEGFALLSAFLDEFPRWRLLFTQLTQRQQLIISYRFGLQRFDGTWLNTRSLKERQKVIIPSFSEISNHLGIYRSPCTRIYFRGMESLKKANELSDYKLKQELEKKSDLIFSNSPEIPSFILT